MVRRFYDELWNGWDLTVADEIVAPDLRFRGSLGTSLAGIEAFKGYVEQVREAVIDLAIGQSCFTQFDSTLVA